MGHYIYTNRDMYGDLPIVIDSEEFPKLEENKAGDHMLKIAIALEKGGIEGVHVEALPGENDQVVYLLHTRHGSFGEIILDHLAVRFLETGLILPVDKVLVLAKKLQETNTTGGVK